MTGNSPSGMDRLAALSHDRKQMLELLARRARRAQQIVPRTREGTQEQHLPASGAQQRLWFFEQLEGATAAYHIPLVIRLRGTLDEAALQAALDELVARHEGLRTVFAAEEGQPVQRVLPPGPFALQRLDLRAQAPEQQDAALAQLLRDELAAPFDIAAGPLIRGKLVALSADTHVLAITVHHIVSDGWSTGVLFRELGVLYEASLAGHPAPLAPLSVQYADYALWQRRSTSDRAYQEQLAYWRTHLQGAPELLEMPTDRPRPPRQTFRGADARVAIDAELTGRLKALSRTAGVTLAMTLYAAWAVVLSRLSGQTDLVIGMPVANRRRPELEGLIGFFVNTLAVRVSLAGEPTVSDLLERVRGVMLKAYECQDAAFEQVVEALQPARSLSHSPIFQVMFALQNAPRGELRLAGLTLCEEPLQFETAKFDLSLVLQESETGLQGVVNYATDLFDAATVERWSGCLDAVLHGFARDRLARVDLLPLLSEHARRQVIESFNATKVDYPHDTLVHRLVEEQARRTPDAVAIACGALRLTYAELNRRANRIAHTLRSCGAAPDQRVALHVERGLDMVVGLLGIMKAGAAYVPLDASYPIERLRYMLRDCGAVAILTQERLRGNFADCTVPTLSLDGEAGRIDSAPQTDLDPQQIGLRAHHMAYVIYTSGSTGMPKGVMVEHRNLANLVQWTCGTFGLGEGCSCSAVAAVGFDAATWEIWPVLSAGGQLFIASQELVGDPEKLVEWWVQQPIDTGFLPTPMAEYALSRGIRNPRVRSLLVGGDRLRMHASGDRFALVNNYGPTEATVLCTSGRIRDDGLVPHIGQPIANTRIYILDGGRQAVPIGVAGEIYIAGVAVARGYLNRPELTAERFLADPFAAEPGERMYRTGDLGRWRTDGTIEYLGRNDSQVKIRGFRIELGEIEAQLATHPSINEAVVAVRGEAGEQRLVAYVTTGSGIHVSAEELRGHLKGLLPEYMLPSAFVTLASLPLTPNGKVDRRALPAPALGAYTSRRYESPRGDLEEILAGVWQSLLGVARVGRDDNFFELGGHSLLIVQMMERLRRVGLSADVRRVFESPTLAELASVLRRAAGARCEPPPNLIPDGCSALTPQMLPLVKLTAAQLRRIEEAVPGGASNVQDVYPLVPLQEGILFHHLMSDRSGDAYVVPVVLALPSRSRLEQFVDALRAVIDRHDILRTAVLWQELPRPVQVVYRQAELPVETATLDPGRDVEEQLREWLEPGHQRMNLQQAPLMRLRVAADPHGEGWYVLWQLHHIVDDATSRRILVAEVAAHLEGRAAQLPAAVPYRSHVAEALSQERVQGAEDFFRRKLGDVDEPTAPFGVLNVYGDASETATRSEDLEIELARRVRLQAGRLAVSAATLFHAAWALVVAATTGRRDVVFGTVLLGRLLGESQTQRMLGMFINTLPLRMPLQDICVQELVERMQRELVELMTHEQASLSAAQRCSGIAGTAPLFTALMNYRHGAADPVSGWGGAPDIRVLAGRAATNYPLTLSVDDLGEGFRLVVQTDRRVDVRRVTQYVREALSSLVAALEQSPQALALSLSIIPQAERHELLAVLNSTGADWPLSRLIHESFEEQVARTPDVAAVLYGQQALTYAELNAAANRLARYLRSRGVGGGQIVGICAERSPDTVVGVLGILKAGAAYLPLDPSYPAERLEHMLRDAAPAVVLTQRALQTTVPAGSAELVFLDEMHAELAGYASDDLARATDPAPDLIYVIYTSGSTGKPKGTAMPHNAMANLIEWHRANLGCEGQRVLQFAALSFDVAFQETFSTLCLGGTLVLLDEWVRRDPRALVDLLRAQRVDRLFLPPMMLQSLAEFLQTTGGAAPALQDVITAGEQLRISPEIVRLFEHMDGCRLHNHYGPTETHVVTALTLEGHPEQWPQLPTIGRPLANTQVYVLDADREPVPFGAVGEIYLAGANVARGYLHRPELTAERFLPDPFGAAPVARMYRTGDLGRWCTDGTLEYLGRNDDQIKIRGFRIELGEIEMQLASHASVREAAVVARQDAPGEKRLVAYITLRTGVRPGADELRVHLKAALPEYMVPSAYVVLDRLPLTPSGKLNRRALPVPEAADHVSRRYVPPQGEIERRLAAIWQALLHVTQIGRDESVFELGGHSLLALKALLRINQACGCALAIRDIYRHPTVQELAARIHGATGDDAPIDLEEEASLDPAIVAAPGCPRSPEQAILLTGATGFVGRFLLARLLEATDATIYCLVRGRSQREAAARLRLALVKWELWREDADERIVAIAGDLRQPRLGIEDAAYEMLCEHVDSIYHCATSMNHLETYAMARAANVGSARDLLRLATARRPKVINVISTLGVFGATVDAERTVDELTPIDGELHRRSQGYVGSKWVSEKIFLRAGERGIACNIFRLGLTWGDAHRGRYDELQHDYRLLKSCLLAGLGICNHRHAMVPIPVDHAARAIVHLAGRHGQGGGIFHIAGSYASSGGMFERCNSIDGVRLRLLPFYDWLCELRQLHREGRSLPIVPLFEFAFGMDRAAAEALQRRSQHASVHIDCTRTQRELQEAGILVPVGDEELLRLCVVDMLMRDSQLREIAQAEGDEPGELNFPHLHGRERAHELRRRGL